MAHVRLPLSQEIDNERQRWVSIRGDLERDLGMALADVARERERADEAERRLEIAEERTKRATEAAVHLQREILRHRRAVEFYAGDWDHRTVRNDRGRTARKVIRG